MKDENSIIPHQQALQKLEQDHKHDGVWGGNLQHGVVPSGQAELNEEFEACHDLIRELLISLEDKKSKK